MVFGKLSLKSLKAWSDFGTDGCIVSNFAERDYTPEHAVAQMVEALRCSPEAGMLDSRWCHWNVLFI